MISPWIDVSEINGWHWVNLWRLLLPPRAGSGRRRPTLYLYHEGGWVVKALLGDEVLPSGFPYPGLEGLKALAEQHGARRAYGIDVHAYAELWGVVESRLRYGDDLLEFGLTVLRELKRGRAYGIDAVPPLALPPIPPRAVIEVLWNLAFPDGHTIALYVVDGDMVYTSLILAKKGGALTVMTTDDGLWDAGLEAGRWRDDLPRLRAEIARRWGPLWAGVFAERKAIEAVRRGERTLRAARRAGEVVLEPWPRRWQWVGLMRRLLKSG